jgi:demethylmenaquinone methyltransferase / 2-methoxy-6-polyprenyl-1,4-benzoquinol methylase
MPTDTERSDQQERSALAAARGGGEKRTYVRAMFSDIAGRYDLLNHLLSLNIDKRWRRRAIAALGWTRVPTGRYLDLCAGTLDVAAELSATPGFAGFVTGADFAEPMLRAGRGKGRSGSIAPVVADALELPLAERSCDGALVAFGVRNLQDLDEGLRQVAGVLRPGARFVILEFTTPPSAIVRFGYHLYFHRILPFIGGLVSGNRTAYRYLPESVAHFPGPDALADRMRSAGFSEVRYELLTFGIAALHVGTRTA